MSPNIIIVIDHSGAKVFRTVPARVNASAREIAPDAPLSFYHTTDRAGHDADRLEKKPQDTAFFDQIAMACKAADRIVMIGRGHGQSNAAQHLIAYLEAHQPDDAQRVLPIIAADLSHMTDGQLIELGNKALHDAARR